jgi:hypothetical protein
MRLQHRPWRFLQKLFTFPPNLNPLKLSLDNFVSVFATGDVPRYALNSLIVATTSSLLTVIASSMAGFALAKYHFLGRSFLLLLIISVLLIPLQVLMVPVFLILKTVGWINSLVGIIIPGRYHDIEVEDDVTAYLEYPDGMTAVFTASTGEAPGTNRLEVAAERGKVIIENDQFLFSRNEVPMTEFSRTDPGRFSSPPVWEIMIPIEGGHGPQHNGILANFVSAILDGTPLIAPAQEGIYSLELANAFLLSTLENRSIELPIDAKLFEEHLKKLIGSSTRKKPKIVKEVSDDMSRSFR